MADLTSSSIPGGDIYGWKTLDANKAYEEALAQLGRKRQNVLQEYGFTGDFDTSGNVSNLRTDPFNQYGRLQSTLRTQAQGYGRLEEAQQERGLYGSGLAAQPSSDARFEAGGEMASLGTDLSNQFLDLSQSQQEAEHTHNDALYQAQLDALRAAIQDQAFTPADYGGGGDSFADYPATDPGADSGAYPDDGSNATDTGGPQGGADPNAKKVLWGGRYMSAAQIAAFERSRGGSVRQWVKNHPTAAKRIGLRMPPPPKPAPKPKNAPKYTQVKAKPKAAPKPKPKPAPKKKGR